MKVTDKEIIENLLNKKIVDSKLLSNSFNINCIKLITSDNYNLIIKYYSNKNYKFNAIKSEANNLKFFKNYKINFFPQVYLSNDDYLVMTYIQNDGKKPNETKEDLLDSIVSIHQINSENYGFEFDTQIGGLKQKNNFKNDWIEFYREYRLGYIYELISSSNPMDSFINFKINSLIKNLHNFIPKNPVPSLLHGDLWEGNILFNKQKFCGLIDPGSFFGHNELEVAYLRWFNPKFIDNNFIDKYNEKVKLDSNYIHYEPIYQLYYSLLNVYLWDRSYINDVLRLIKKIKI